MIEIAATEADAPPTVRVEVDDPRYPAGTGPRIGIDEVRDGVRPLVVAGGEEFGLRLVDPLNPEEILAEAPPPLRTYWEVPGTPSIINGDFDGDGAMEVVVLGTPAGDMDDELAILDGTTLETLVSRDEVEGYAFERLQAGRPSFGDAYRAFLERFSLAEVGVVDELFTKARDRSPGRKVRRSVARPSRP